MKILFLNYEYPPLGGGAGNATAYLLEEFASEKNLEVHLVTSAMGDITEHIRVGGEVFVHRVPIGKSKERLHSQSLLEIVRFFWSGLRTSRKLVRSSGSKFDVTLAFFGFPCGAQALILKWLYGIPYVVALRGSDVPGYNEKYRFLYPLFRPLIRLIWSQAATVIPNSAGLCDLAAKTAPKQAFHIIENGVDTKHFSPDSAKRPKDEFIITPGASRLTERKGLRYLIEAVALLAPRFPELCLKILGEGSARFGLETLVREKGVAERVKFLGRIPREATAQYYQEASLFVLPSLNEGMSNAMLEALASGLPIIATDTGGTKELLRPGENGVVVPMKSIPALAEAIEFFLVDRTKIDQYGQASRDLAEKKSWHTVAQSFLEILKQAPERTKEI